MKDTFLLFAVVANTDAAESVRDLVLFKCLVCEQEQQNVWK